MGSSIIVIIQLLKVDILVLNISNKLSFFSENRYPAIPQLLAANRSLFLSPIKKQFHLLRFHSLIALSSIPDFGFLHLQSLLKSPFP